PPGNSLPPEHLHNGTIEDERGGRDIYEANTDRLELRDLVVVPPPRLRANHDVLELGGALDRRPAADGEQVARLQTRLVDRVDDDQAGATDRLFVELAAIRPVAPHRVEVRSGPQPCPFEDRLRRRRGGHHDVRAAHRLLGRFARHSLHAARGLRVPAELTQTIPVPAEGPDLLESPHDR